MKRLLYVNSCIERGTSRTCRLADALITELRMRGEYDVEELILEDEQLVPMNGSDITRRSACISSGDLSGPEFRYARQLRDADLIVTAAPFWDGSFPSMFKCWLERVCVNGLTFRYSENGVPIGMCNADQCWYVTTVGGYLRDGNLGMDNVRFVLGDLCGIKDCRYIDAQGLDIIGNDPGKIMDDAVASISEKI